MEDPLPKLRNGYNHLLKYLRRGIGRFRKAEIRRLAERKKNILLGCIVLMLGMGIFFNAFFDFHAEAQKNEMSGPVSREVIDPLDKIGKGISQSPTVNPKSACSNEDSPKDENKLSEVQLQAMLAGYPIAKMIPSLAKRDRATAAFLVAIARKESSWGVHSPRKAGRDCYNYWGYKGSYNLSREGYSCFDSPEQAVGIVGNRIDTLLNKHINTPQKMVVWKCGSATCAGFDPYDVGKWISDVAFYYKKLQS